MSCYKSVIDTFLAFWKTGKSAFLPQGGKLIFSSGQQFVRIALMPYIPDNLVLRAVKNTVKCNRQFHCSQIRRQMSATFCGGLDQCLPNFCTQWSQLLKGKIFQIFR